MERMFKRRNAVFWNCTKSELAVEGWLLESGSQMEESSMDSLEPSMALGDPGSEPTPASEPSVLCRMLLSLRGSSVRSSPAGRFLREWMQI